jgi:DNA-binding transcriptional MocR family regulator
LLRPIIEQNRLASVGVPTDDDGLDVDALEAVLASGALRPRLVYLVPTCSNPTGATLLLERRKRLIALAHAYGFDLVCDEVYQLLSFPGERPPPPMRDVERQMRAAGELPAAAAAAASGDGGSGRGSGSGVAGEPPPPPPPSRVVSLGSFSKMLAPGLRLGWAEACDAALDRLRSDGVLVSGGACGCDCVRGLHDARACSRKRALKPLKTIPPPPITNENNTGCIAPLSSAIAHSTIELGLLQQHLHGHVRPTLAARCNALCAAIDAELAPLGCSYRRPAGGYFVWLRLPPGVDAGALNDLAAARHGARFAPGPLCLGPASAARLSFAFYGKAELKEGVSRLAAALREALDSGAATAAVAAGAEPDS